MMNSTASLPPGTGASGGAGTRTLWELFYSCAATIIAYTWVSIHPNVPGRRDSGFDKFKRRVGLMVLALIAPEFIAYLRSGRETLLRGFAKVCAHAHHPLRVMPEYVEISQGLCCSIREACIRTDDEQEA
jgi:hypothetical protein